MKTAIVYSSKTGATAECARELYRLIPEAEMFNLAVDRCDPEKFDNVIIGGGIRAGMLPKDAKKFVKNNLTELQKKNIGLFVCCFDNEKAEQYIETNLPAVLTKKAVATAGFGSRIDIGASKGFDRFVIKAAEKNLKKNGQPLPQIHKDIIASFAKKFI